MFIPSSYGLLTLPGLYGPLLTGSFTDLAGFFVHDLKWISNLPESNVRPQIGHLSLTFESNWFYISKLNWSTQSWDNLFFFCGESLYIAIYSFKFTLCYLSGLFKISEIKSGASGNFFRSLLSLFASRCSNNFAHCLTWIK